MDNTDVVLRVDNLSKLYKNGRGARNISFELRRGDVLGLLGPNGSGKTSTMKVIVGLCHPTDGKVEIFGRDVDRDYERATEKVGSLIEAPAIYDYLSAQKNVKLAANCHKGISSERTDQILDMVGLGRYKRDKVSRFSLGMKQRLGLALALIGEPEVVVLDEPANGLDIEGIMEVRDLVHGLSEKRNVAFLISSHLASEIERTCNMVAVMHEGEMLSFDTMENALRHSPTLEDYYLERVREKRGTKII